MKLTIIRDDTSDEVEVTLRVFDLDEADFQLMKTELEVLKIPYKSRAKGSHRLKRHAEMGASIGIDISIENVDACRKILQEYGAGTRDIWISYYTEYDQGGFTIPNWVTSIANELHLPIQISYMAL